MLLENKVDVMKYSHSIGICVMTGRGFMFPVDTAISKDGRIHTISRGYIPATYQMRVTMYDIDSEFFGVYGGFGKEPGETQLPAGMAADAEGNVYLSDEQGDRITVYDNDGNYLSHWGVSGSDRGQLRGPSGISFDDDGNLLVSDHLNNRIQKFTSDGSFISSLGDVGPEEHRLHLPWGVTASHDNNVFVADWGNHRIVKYSEDGEFLDSFGSEGRSESELNNPSGVAVDLEGRIYVSDWGNERIQIFGPDGQFLQSLRGESTVSQWGVEAFEANQQEANARKTADLEPPIEQFGGDPYEESAHIEKFFWGPTSIKLDGSGKLYVTESNRHRIQIYEPIGN